MSPAATDCNDDNAAQTQNLCTHVQQLCRPDCRDLTWTGYSLFPATFYFCQIILNRISLKKKTFNAIKGFSEFCKRAAMARNEKWVFEKKNGKAVTLEQMKVNSLSTSYVKGRRNLFDSLLNPCCFFLSWFLSSLWSLSLLARTPDMFNWNCIEENILAWTFFSILCLINDSCLIAHLCSSCKHRWTLLFLSKSYSASPFHGRLSDSEQGLTSPSLALKRSGWVVAFGRAAF